MHRFIITPRGQGWFNLMGIKSGKAATAVVDIGCESFIGFLHINPRTICTSASNLLINACCQSSLVELHTGLPVYIMDQPVTMGDQLLAACSLKSAMGRQRWLLGMGINRRSSAIAFLPTCHSQPTGMTSVWHGWYCFSTWGLEVTGTIVELTSALLKGSILGQLLDSPVGAISWS